MMEQIDLYANCELGRRIMDGQKPSSVEDFRKSVPLTSYQDYADILLQNQMKRFHQNRCYGSKPPGKVEITRKNGHLIRKT